MRYSFFLLNLISFFFCAGQSAAQGGEFQLKGKITGRDTGDIVLWYPNYSGSYVRDTTRLDKGNFKFQGMVSEPSFAHLIGTGKGDYSNFFLEAGDQSVMLEEGHFDKIQLLGSRTQQLNDSLQNELDKISARISVLEARRAHLDSIRKKETGKNANLDDQELDKKINTLYDELINQRISFIKAHPRCYVSVTELSGLLVVHRYPVNLARPLFESLDEKVRKGRAGSYCLKEIEARSKLTAGNDLSTFKALDQNNRQFSLNDLKEKYVLVDFWASWCLPCREAIPGLKKAYDEYHSRGFEILAVSLDRNKEQWEKAIRTDKTGNWVQVLENAEMQSIFQPIQAIPQQLLLNREGKIIWSSLDVNTKTWIDVLKEHLTAADN